MDFSTAGTTTVANERVNCILSICKQLSGVKFK